MRLPRQKNFSRGYGRAWFIGGIPGMIGRFAGKRKGRGVGTFLGAGLGLLGGGVLGAGLGALGGYLGTKKAEQNNGGYSE